MNKTSVQILILYQISHHKPLILNLVNNLSKEGFNINAFDISKFSFIHNPCFKIPFYVKLIKKLFHIPYVWSLLYKLGIINIIIFNIAKKYSLIDIHFFSSIYDSVIDKLYNINKKIKITIWGSDFYRATIKRREIQRNYFEKCSCIQVGSLDMKNDFLNYFHDFENKINIAHFGNSLFEYINKISKDKSFKLNFLHSSSSDKIILSCGYNGSKAQQHELIIDAIDKIDNNLKQKIFLIFPLTYGTPKNYKNQIIKKLSLLNIPFQIISEYLVDSDTAKLRLIGDIVVNIQHSDAFSASLQEYIYAENLLLVGDWLPYSILDKKEIFYKKTNLENLSTEIEDCIINLNVYKNKIMGNKEKIYALSSWEAATPELILMYKKCIDLC